MTPDLDAIKKRHAKSMSSWQDIADLLDLCGRQKALLEKLAGKAGKAIVYYHSDCRAEFEALGIKVKP